MTETDPVVRLWDLTKTFGDFTAVDGISLTVREGEIFGFLGPNGAGKSTTIKMICGLYKPSSGEGTVAGYDIYDEQTAIRQHIGYMSQAFSLYEDLTVEENLNFYASTYRIPADRRVERKEDILELASLADQRDRLTGELPRGWQQRLSLGTAIMHQPDILFLDEPTSGVDPRTRRTFWDWIYALSDSGMTVFVTTHYMEEAEYCDRLGLISKGKLVATGTPEDLKLERMDLEVLEVDCEKGQEALGVVDTMDGVHDAYLFGMKLHLVVKDARRRQDEIVQKLDRAGHSVRQSRIIPPSMEDVFVRLVLQDSGEDER